MCIGQGTKRKHGDGDILETYALLCDRADERAAKREERMRLRELEIEERRIEKENRHEERMFSMMAAIMQQMPGRQGPPFNPLQYQAQFPNDPMSPYYQDDQSLQ